ncbi:unnamed protein product, partial [marine sediment metagenome]
LNFLGKFLILKGISLNVKAVNGKRQSVSEKSLEKKHMENANPN